MIHRMQRNDILTLCTTFVNEKTEADITIKDVLLLISCALRGIIERKCAAQKSYIVPDEQMHIKHWK